MNVEIVRHASVDLLQEVEELARPVALVAHGRLIGGMVAEDRRNGFPGVGIVANEELLDVTLQSPVGIFQQLHKAPNSASPLSLRRVRQAEFAGEQGGPRLATEHELAQRRPGLLRHTNFQKQAKCARARPNACFTLRVLAR